MKGSTQKFCTIFINTPCLFSLKLKILEKCSGFYKKVTFFDQRHISWMKKAIFIWLLELPTVLLGQESNNLSRFHVSFPPLICFYAEALPSVTDTNSHVEPVLLLDTTEIVPVENTYMGYLLTINNTSGSSFSFRCSNDCLLLYAEVETATGWIPVTSIMEEDCGSGPVNYTTLSDQMRFEIAVPHFEGTLSVKMRYALIWNGQKIVSNTINSVIDSGQLSPKNMPPHLRSLRLSPDNF